MSVSVLALVVRQANRIFSAPFNIVACGLPRSTIFSHIIPQIARFLRKKFIELKCLLFFSLQCLSETVLVLKELSEILSYEAYPESKYNFTVKKNRIRFRIKFYFYQILHSSNYFFHIFAAIIEALTVEGHKVLYTLLIECGRLRC